VLLATSGVVAAKGLVNNLEQLETIVNALDYPVAPEPMQEPVGKHIAVGSAK
jgi:hypothetical protein